MRLLPRIGAFFQSRRYLKSNSVKLSYNRYGADDDRNHAPILIAHGLFGQKRHWHSVAKMLQKRLRNQVFVVDLRNHGQSPWTSTMTLGDMAGDLTTFINDVICVQSGFNTLSLVGHSMGGKVAILFALDHSDCLNKLIIEDIALRDYAREGNSKIFSYVEKMQNAEEEFSQFSCLSKARKNTDEFLRETVTDLHTRQFLLTNLHTKNDGTMGWRFNLKTICEYLSDIHGFPSIINRQFNGPTLMISASESPYVSNEDVVLFRNHFPNVSHQTVVGAGHMIHFERPVQFVDLVHNFVSE